MNVVKTESLKLELPPDGFRLSSGGVLKEITVAFERYGELDAERGNAIFICHALTADAHAAFHHDPEDNRTAGWWNGLIGPGKGIDTDKFHVVCANILGGCKGTTGPASIDPDTGKPYGVNFPLLTIWDTVEVEKMFLAQLGIDRLYAVAGGSLGGMRTLAWALKYPELVERCVCVAASAYLSPQALAFDVIARQAIESDPEYHQGHYAERGTAPAEGLSRARQIGHVTYLSSQSMLKKFGRGVSDTPIPGVGSPFSTNFEVESYLNYQGRKLVSRFDALSYLYITRMMDLFDLGADYGSVTQAFEQCQGKFLVVSISSDWLFPPEQQLELVAGLMANRKSVSYFQIESSCGHDAFLIEYDQLAAGVGAFLEGKAADGPAPKVNRMDLELISEMMPAGAHILDVGSGDGGLLVALQERKQATGICLDLSFAMIVECMRKGLAAIQLDADKGIELIPADSFDCVLLNQTIQQLHSALQTIKQILRIAPSGLIGFPNFAYYAYRLKIAFGGRLPVSGSLPYEWYDTPNIHLVTVRDFRDLCERHGISIAAMEHIDDSVLGRLLMALGRPNLGAERVLVKIARNHVED